MASTGTWHVYRAAIGYFTNKQIDWDSDAGIKALLTTSAHTPNQNTHATKSDITNEASGTGYTARGAALTGKAVSTSGSETRYDADDLNWPSSSVTARNIHIYLDTGTDSTSLLIAYCTLSGDETSVAGNWPHTFDATGIFGITVS